ncbi:MAG: NAD-dependent epimerase/dehydratase family protein [Planctomycetes bacterium]|nr:NAD-dependent epimerase/dehydratase family protein [Planctomycetota bacterium]
MNPTPDDLLLITGATGLVGSHVAEESRRRGLRTRAIVRTGSDVGLLKDWGVEVVEGELNDAESLRRACDRVTILVHCAAKVGDWGPVEDYREVNVRGLDALLDAARNAAHLKRYVHISSLGIYEARDHWGTDETEPPSRTGIDGYTLSKVEAEDVVRRHIDEHALPAVILRPGFIYGPRDRTVLPRLLEKLKGRKVKFLGSGEQLMNNTYVGNLIDAVFLAIERDAAVGETFNITDGRLVSKREFIGTIAEEAGLPVPKRSVPLPVARVLARGMEGLWKLLRKREAPLLSSARIKFLGLNLDFSIGKARRELGYEPAVEFRDGVRQTVRSFRETGRL